MPALLTLALGLGGVWASSGIRDGMLPSDPGPAFMPMMASVLLIVLSLGQLALPRELHELLPGRAGLLKVLATVAATLAMILLLRRIGFLAATTLFLAVQMWITGVRGALQLTLIPLLGAMAVYVLFRYLLEVPLPPLRIWGLVW